MILDHIKLSRAFTFTKNLASAVTLNFLPETLIWNKTAFLASNLLKLEGLVVNPLKKTISKNYLPILILVYNFVKITIVKISRGHS